MTEVTELAQLKEEATKLGITFSGNIGVSALLAKIDAFKELNAAKEDSERNNKDDLVESFRRILEAAQKINPEEKAAYVINDQEGMRYFEIDYNEINDKPDLAPCSIE